jgi:type I restriction enzyme S subunit
MGRNGNYNWNTAKLGDVADLYDSHRVPLNSHQRHERQGQFPYYGAQGIIDYIDDYIFDGRYILVAEDGENLNSRKLPLALFATGKFWVNNHAHVLRGKSGFVDEVFLLACLNNADVKPFVTGAAQPKLSQANLRQIELLLPPLPTQRRIASILSAYDDLIENSQRRIKILEAMARALYREWFVHFRFPGHKNHPRVAPPLGEIPEGWEVKKLESLMVDHIGGGWGKEAPDDAHTEPAWVIRGTDIPGARSSQVADVPHRFHTPSNLRSRRLVAGDILFEVSGGSKGQPVGRTLLITPELLSAFDGDVICASFCKRIRPDAAGYGSELLFLSFLEGYESGEIEQFQVQSTGISNFQWAAYIAKIERVIPPATLRSRFREHVAPLFTQIAILGRQTQNLRRTRDLLLPRLLSGQIDVEAA